MPLEGGPFLVRRGSFEFKDDSVPDGAHELTTHIIFVLISLRFSKASSGTEVWGGYTHFYPQTAWLDMILGHLHMTASVGRCYKTESRQGVVRGPNPQNPGASTRLSPILFCSLCILQT